MSGPSAQDLLIRARLINQVSRPLAEIKAELATTVGSIDKADGATKAQTASVMQLGREYRKATGEAAALAKLQEAAARKQLATGKMLMTRVSLPAALALGYTIKKASDLNETLNLGTHEFGRQAKAVEAWARSGATSMGLSTRAALQYAGGFNEVFRAIGVGPKASADMAKTLTRIGADLASFYNTSTDQAELAINSLMAGQSRPLRQYHKFATEAALKQEALNLGFKVTGAAMTPVVRQQAAYAYLLEHTTREAGDFVRTSDQVANRLRVVGAQTENAAADLGKSLLPAVAATLGVFGGFVEVMEHAPGPIKTMVLATLGIAAAAAPIIYVTARVKLLRLQLQAAGRDAAAASTAIAGVAGSRGATLAGEASAASGMGALVARAGGWGRLGWGAMALGGAIGAGGGFGRLDGKAGSAVQSALGLGMTGASIGSMIAPGVGTAVGGGIGAALGLGSSLWSMFGSKVHKAGDESKYTSDALRRLKDELKANGIAVGSVAGQYAILQKKIKDTKDQLDARLGPKLDLAAANVRQRQALLDYQKTLRDPKASALDREASAAGIVDATQAVVLAQQGAGIGSSSPKAAAAALAAQLNTVAANSPQFRAFYNRMVGSSSVSSGLRDYVAEETKKAQKRAGQKRAGTLLQRNAKDDAWWNANFPRPGGSSAVGDTTVARGHDGNIGRTLELHAMADAMTPGRRWVTNAFHGNALGDHPAGRALDLVGDNLSSYTRTLKRLGGWAEPHGAGGGRHLHAVYGDTATPRPRAMAMAGGGGDTFVFQIDARGSSMRPSEFRAIAREAVAEASAQATERRARPIGRG